MSKLLKLVERCEAMRGANRPLSWDIWDALGKPRVCEWSRGCSAPSYTASLDAAMTLVPEGWSVSLYSHPGEANATVYLLGGVVDNGINLDRPALQIYEAVQIATPALALCAAALRARAGTKNERENLARKGENHEGEVT